MSSIVPKDIRSAFPVHVPQDAVRSKLLELLGLDEIPTGGGTLRRRNNKGRGGPPRHGVDIRELS